MKLLGSHPQRSPYADLPFFAGWTAHDLERMEHVAEVVDYRPGELITWQGQLALEFVVIVSGGAAVLADGKQVGLLCEGDTVGELAMLGGTSSPVTVVAETPLRALLLAPREFNGLLTEAPSMGRRLATLLAGRLREQPDRSSAAA